VSVRLACPSESGVHQVLTCTCPADARPPLLLRAAPLAINVPATKQVRYNKAAIAAAKAGKPLPDGSVLFVEVYAAGSAPVTKIIGIVELAFFAASAGRVPPTVTITSTLRAMRSAAKAGS
jgi:hypothetical protein